MTQVIAFNRITTGLLYLNDFNSIDDTTKIGVAGWTLNTPSSSLDYNGIEGAAVKSLAPANYYVSSRIKSTTTAGILGLTVRMSDINNYYILRLILGGGGGSTLIQKKVASVATNLASANFGALSVNTYYLFGLYITGTTIDSMESNGSTANYLTTTDGALSAAANGGVYAIGNPAVISHDYIAISSGVKVTVNGLLDSQKFIIYDLLGNKVVTSAASVGGTVSVDITPISPIKTVPPFTKMDITDIDGVTIIYTTGTLSLTNGIFGGDVYQAQITQVPLKTLPPLFSSIWQQPKIQFVTTKKAYT